VFWKRARLRYGHVTDDDPDIRRYFRITSEFQQSGYRGLTGAIQDIGHRWVAARTPPGRVLELGAGAGRHALFYRGEPHDLVASEFAAGHFTAAPWRGPLRGRGVRCDARRLPFADGAFGTVISIYNLEHIRDLDAVFHEVRRVLRDNGRFLVALPCEGGLLWNLGREMTTRPRFQRRYGINYDKVIAYEHVHDFGGVLERIRASGCFAIDQVGYFPFRLPSVHVNLIGCIECRRAPGAPQKG
jgi:SAM-dependent methyltransferase